jgi:hypothetical protein
MWKKKNCILGGQVYLITPAAAAAAAAAAATGAVMENQVAQQ